MASGTASVEEISLLRRFRDLLLHFQLLLTFFLQLSLADTITPSRTIRDGQTLVSSGGIFALGFFSPQPNLTNRYLGIWYARDPARTVVWVANRENPIATNPSAVALLAVTGGNLAIYLDGQGYSTPLWSTNISSMAEVANRSASSSSPLAVLLDSGNLVLKAGSGGSSERVLWQSFDHPTDTFLPGMKIGLDRRRGRNWRLTSWKTAGDPAPGEFWYGIDLVKGGMPQFFVMRGRDRVYRSGSWNGLRLTGALNASSLFHFRYVANGDEDYFTYALSNSSSLLRMVLNESGALEQYTWEEKSRRWNLGTSFPRDECGRYARCGPNGMCDPTALPELVCACLRGFEPRSAASWSMGCARRQPLQCRSEGSDGFMKLERAKLPDASRSSFAPELSLPQCERLCLANCSCTAYASATVGEGGSNGCAMWFGDLVDMRVYSDGGQGIYIRVDASEMDRTSKSSRDSLSVKLLAGIIPSVAALLAFVAFGCYWHWWKKKGDDFRRRHGVLFHENGIKDGSEDSELIYFHSDVIVDSTSNFSEENMLGKGGFGSVYKGRLSNGKEIAVKRLSKSSGQGVEEFKNEVTLIARLQHRNLVRLLGCCIDGEEKMLIYEYMKNKSLDSIIFDKAKKETLDWRKRFNIIMGIARGVLYLHEDSRLRIIHRDLKASNILLDDEMNPRISDFGLARIFGGNQTQGKTDRVMGTFGYMSPEYAMNGLFSIKSDVFSFGIILLEIISGKRSNAHSANCSTANFVGYAWKLFKENEAVKFVDSSMRDSFSKVEVLRCIQVGLLCVEQRPKDRPNMSSVVFMLGNDTDMPTPKQPAFCLKEDEIFHHLHSSTQETAVNSQSSMTITEMEAR